MRYIIPSVSISIIIVFGVLIFKDDLSSRETAKTFDQVVIDTFTHPAPEDGSDCPLCTIRSYVWEVEPNEPFEIVVYDANEDMLLTIVDPAFAEPNEPEGRWCRIDGDETIKNGDSRYINLPMNPIEGQIYLLIENEEMCTYMFVEPNVPGKIDPTTMGDCIDISFNPAVYGDVRIDSTELNEPNDSYFNVTNDGKDLSVKTNEDFFKADFNHRFPDLNWMPTDLKEYQAGDLSLFTVILLEQRVKALEKRQTVFETIFIWQNTEGKRTVGEIIDIKIQEGNQ